MAKTKISEYSATAANNTDVESVNIAEGCAPSGINNAIREVMSHLKDFQVGSAGDDLTVGGNFSVTGTVTIPDNAISGDKVEGGTINAITINTLSANPTLSAGTANGVTYLNGSKVLTSGSALTTNGSSLGVGSSDFGGAGSINVSVGVAGTTTGGLQLWSTTTGQHYVQFGDGTAGAATYAGAIGYSHATDQMSFYASATEQMRLTSTGLGIGTSSPAAKLHVVNTAYIKGSASTDGDKGITISSGSGAVNTSSHAIRTGGGLGDLLIIETETANSSGQIVFNTNSAERLRIDSSGNVGIGTASPSAKLQVDSSSATYSANIRARNSNFGNGVVGAASGILTVATDMNNIAFYTGSNLGVDGTSVPTNERMRIDSSGNLLVGTTSLYGGEKLALVQSTNNRGFVIQQTNASNTSPPFLIDCSRNTTNETYNALAYYNSGAGAYRFYVTDNGGGYFNGNLLVGTTSVISLGKISTAFDGSVAFGATYKTTYGFLGSTFVAFVNSAGTTQGSIYANATSSVQYLTSSDYRLKENIAPMTGALAKVSALKPVTYNWKADGSSSQGFIAHELAEVLPECVGGEKDAVDAEGNPRYQGVDTSFLVATLTAAIQEQQAIIESLTARVSALEGN
jgi:hypothetical protein